MQQLEEKTTDFAEVSGIEPIPETPTRQASFKEARREPQYLRLKKQANEDRLMFTRVFKQLRYFVDSKDFAALSCSNNQAFVHALHDKGSPLLKTLFLYLATYNKLRGTNVQIVLADMDKLQVIEFKDFDVPAKKPKAKKKAKGVVTSKINEEVNRD